MQNCVCDGDLLVEPPSRRFLLLIFSLWLSRGLPSTSVGHCVRAPLQQRYTADPPDTQTSEPRPNPEAVNEPKVKNCPGERTRVDRQMGGDRLGAVGAPVAAGFRLQGIKKVLLLDLAQLQLLPRTLKRIISRRGSKKTC